MAVTNPDRSESSGPQIAGFGDGWLVAAALAGFLVLWVLFHTVALAPVDLRDDASEAALWAQTFAFGYKHPPMTAWLFMAWFAVFPRADWAMHLMAATLVTVTLAITWPLLRDYLDRKRAWLGLAALMLIPLYTVKAEELNANTVMMPFWAAALLFYLRARRGLGLLDSVLASAFASAGFLGKYWAVYLFPGMAAASVSGVGTRRFWRSPSPYLMALSAAIVVAPHLYWYLSQIGGTNYAFMRDSVMTGDPFGTVVAKSAYYILGIIAYAAGPLVLLALLRPSRAALADIVWPVDDDRRQALILFLVPMLLPALVNLVAPYRLTPDWTFPNWTLLPVALFASPLIAVDAFAAKAAKFVTFAATLACLAASPFIAYQRLGSGLDQNRPSSQQVAEMVKRIAFPPPRLYWGSAAITGNLPFYLAGSHPLDGDPPSVTNAELSKNHGLLIACLDNDAPCRTMADRLSGPNRVVAAGTIRPAFLGFAGVPVSFHVGLVPPNFGR
jgi:4-amino-4-deoxy-L-arabinose transferase-like glycosyltransferase